MRNVIHWTRIKLLYTSNKTTVQYKSLKFSFLWSSAKATRKKVILCTNWISRQYHSRITFQHKFRCKTQFASIIIEKRNICLIHFANWLLTIFPKPSQNNLEKAACKKMKKKKNVFTTLAPFSRNSFTITELFFGNQSFGRK